MCVCVCVHACVRACVCACRPELWSVFGFFAFGPSELKCTSERNGQKYFNGSLSENQREPTLYFDSKRRRQPRGLGVWGIDALQCDSNQNDEGDEVGRDGRG